MLVPRPNHVQLVYSHGVASSNQRSDVSGFVDLLGEESKVWLTPIQRVNQFLESFGRHYRVNTTKILMTAIPINANHVNNVP